MLRGPATARISPADFLDRESASAMGINDSGQVVGWTGTGNVHAFLYGNGVMQDLGVGEAFGISGNGQVTGWASVSTGFGVQEHAFLYSGGGWHDLGTFSGGTSSIGFAVNDRGQVVGGADQVSTGSGHAFLYTAGRMQDLGTLGGRNSTAYGINDAGQIVGYSEIASLDWHAFLSAGGAMQDLNSLINPSSGWVLQRAFGINDLGQITGDGSINGQIHAFMLSPIPVPEPSTIRLAVLGFVALTITVWRRRSLTIGPIGRWHSDRSRGIVAAIQDTWFCSSVCAAIGLGLATSCFIGCSSGQKESAAEQGAATEQRVQFHGVDSGYQGEIVRDSNGKIQSRSIPTAKGAAP